MIHAFLLIVVLGGKVQSQDMYFRLVVDQLFCIEASKSMKPP